MCGRLIVRLMGYANVPSAEEFPEETPGFFARRVAPFPGLAHAFLDGLSGTFAIHIQTVRGVGYRFVEEADGSEGTGEV